MQNKKSDDGVIFNSVDSLEEPLECIDCGLALEVEDFFASRKRKAWCEKCKVGFIEEITIGDQ